MARFQVDTRSGDGWAAMGYTFTARDTQTSAWIGVYATAEEAQTRCDELNAPADGTTFTREDGSTGVWINGLPRSTQEAA